MISSRIEVPVNSIRDGQGRFFLMSNQIYIILLKERKYIWQKQKLKLWNAEQRSSGQWIRDQSMNSQMNMDLMERRHWSSRYHQKAIIHQRFLTGQNTLHSSTFQG